MTETASFCGESVSIGLHYTVLRKYHTTATFNASVRVKIEI